MPRQPWASEHLGFNRFAEAGADVNTGFCSRRCRRAAGVDAAVASVPRLAAALPVGFSIETGVNYLQTQRGQLSDGAFIAAVAEEADCGILLDLHNLWANERNGRQTVKEFLAELPLERVNEVHIAGGLEHRGYWLDAHSRSRPEPACSSSPSGSCRSSRTSGRSSSSCSSSTSSRSGSTASPRSSRSSTASGSSGERRAGGAPPAPRDRESELWAAVSPAEWESALGALVIGREPRTAIAALLADDPGIAILREMVANFRSGMIVDALQADVAPADAQRRRTSSCPSCSRGSSRALAPQLFASAEAEAFAAYLTEHAPPTAHLDEVLVVRMREPARAAARCV